MKVTLKKCIIIAALFLFSGALQAQHEFSVHGGCGLSGLRYSPTTGTQNNGLGGHFGLGYGYFPTPRWSLSTGADIAVYNSVFKLGSLTNIGEGRDNYHGENFPFRSVFSDYEEKQRAFIIQIPLMARFWFGASHMFYTAGGGRIGIPLNGKYDSSVKNINNAGYYAREDTWHDTQTFRGFGDFPNHKETGTLDFKLAFLLSLEAGVKFALTEKTSLHAGAYLDYGINNILKSVSEPFVSSSNPTGSTDVTFEVNSVLRSQYAVPSAGPAVASTPGDFTGKLSPAAVGIKVRLAFGSGKKRAFDNLTDTAPQIPSVLPTEEVATKTVTINIVDKEGNPVLPTAFRIRNLSRNEEITDLKDEGGGKWSVALRIGDTYEIDYSEIGYAHFSATFTVAPEEDTVIDAKIEKITADPKMAFDRDAAIAAIQQPTDGYTISQTTLTTAQIQDLDRRIVLLKQFPDIKFHVYGHTCDYGDNAINETIGLQRAENAKAYIISQGIAENRILGTASKLDTEPLVPDTSEENRRKNRRVELKVLE